MAAQTRFDAVVVGSGPNGLAAAIVAAAAGLSVLVLEANDTIGGGARSAELTLPGFVHDVCSAVHPLAAAAPFFRTLPLQRHGLEWIQQPAAFSHPFDEGSAAVMERSVDATAARLGVDGRAYRMLWQPLVDDWQNFYRDALGPLHIPHRPLTFARFGLRGLLATTWLTRAMFRDPRSRAMFGGIAAHATLPLNEPPSAAFGFVLGVAGHAVGWPIPRGGSQAVSRALVSYLQSLGGQIQTNRRVESLDELPPSRVVFLDVTPRQVLRIMGDRLPPVYRGQLRHYRYGLGTFKMDWVLDAPIPWRAADCARAATVHLGGSLEEMTRAHVDAWAGKIPARPFVILAQPTLFDRSRVPDDTHHIVWGYAHLPNGSTADISDRIEAQVERFAPGFRDRIVARRCSTPADLERSNANLVGGDLNGGEANLAQLLTRPALRLDPYATPLGGVYICSSSTPPGGGVHGMSGYHAARSALHYLRN
ncbi:MAG TPA: NAD(P)/FAD-dependent oxidoreductase [Chloroflexota bacterium]